MGASYRDAGQASRHCWRSPQGSIHQTDSRIWRSRVRSCRTGEGIGGATPREEPGISEYGHRPSPRRCHLCLGRRRRTQSSDSQGGRARPDIHLGRDGSETTVMRTAPDYRASFLPPRARGRRGARRAVARAAAAASELGDAPLTASKVTRLPTGWCSRPV
jgi:hypothetical protein